MIKIRFVVATILYLLSFPFSGVAWFLNSIGGGFIELGDFVKGSL
jgi:hypothetical protein